VGALALASLLPVAALGLADTQGRPRSVLAGALLIGIASAAAGLLYVAVLALAGVQLPDLPAVVATAVSGGIYNAVLAIATYPLCRMARRGTEKQASFGGQAW
jgi:Na+/phosphate symporter